MRCFHPDCSSGNSPVNNWEEAAETMDAEGLLKGDDAEVIPGLLNSIGPLGNREDIDWPSEALRQRLLAACPCLYTQIPERASAAAVVHLAEITLERPIDSSNVHAAFLVQHPAKGPAYAIPPLVRPTDGGGIMEALCSEVLTNSGVPEMRLDGEGWPLWDTGSHLLLNRGKASALKLYGDILIPAMPHNLLVSVKSEAARERLVVSGNRLESVGFGFFNNPAEFWSQSRIAMYKRWGFTAIYMPSETLQEVLRRIGADGRADEAVNVNGKALYRPLAEFGPDLAQVAGRITLDL